MDKKEVDLVEDSNLPNIAARKSSNSEQPAITTTAANITKPTLAAEQENLGIGIGIGIGESVHLASSGGTSDKTSTADKTSTSDIDIITDTNTNTNSGRRLSAEIIYDSAKSSLAKIRDHIAQVGLVTVFCSIVNILAIYQVYMKNSSENGSPEFMAEFQPSVYNNTPVNAPQDLLYPYENMAVIPYNRGDCPAYYIGTYDYDSYVSVKYHLSTEHPLLTFFNDIGWPHEISQVVLYVAFAIAVFQPTRKGIGFTIFIGICCGYGFKINSEGLLAA